MDQLVNDRPRPALGFSHIGDRYLLGYGDDFYAIYDRLERRPTPTEPVAVFPRTAEGWVSAWQLFSSWEPNSHPVSPKRSLHENSATGSQVSTNQNNQPVKVMGFAEKLTQNPAPIQATIAPIQIKSHSNKKGLRAYIIELHRFKRRVHLLKAKTHPLRRVKKLIKKTTLKLSKKKIL